MIRYILLWFALLAGAILNAALRDFTYGRMMAEELSHRLSVIPAMVIFGVIIWAACRRWPLVSRGRALAVGLVWVAMTEAFEVLMIVFLQKKPVEVFLDMHRVWECEPWPLLLLWVAVAPVLFTRRGRGPGPEE